MFVHHHCSSEDRWIAAEPLFPVAVTQHHDRMTIGNAVIVRCNCASERRGHTEDVEVGPRHQLRSHALRLPAGGEAHLSRKAAEHAGEGLIVVLEIAVHRIRYGVAAPVVSIMAAPGGEQYQLLRILYRKKAEQNLVQQGKNGGVSADAECQSQHGQGGEHGILGQHTGGIPNIGKKMVHLFQPPGGFIHLDGGLGPRFRGFSRRLSLLSGKTQGVR